MEEIIELDEKTNVKINTTLHNTIKKLGVDLGMFIYEIVEVALEDYIKKVKVEKEATD